jgi:hypothetical protein
MACLVHNPRYRSLFHAVVNELRTENRTPMYMLRSMPNKCCTCKDIDKLILISVLLNDKDKLINLKNLINQIDRDKQDNPKLVLSLNRVENFIKENRSLTTNSSATDVSQTTENDSSASESEEHSPMDTGKPVLKKKNQKPTKPLKNGTFLFLPYNFEDKPNCGSLLEVAKKLQRGRFIGRNGYIASLEKEHNVCINMITSKTTEQITATLKNAKEGTGNVKVHNQKDVTDEENGEWLLVRQKKKDEEPTDATDFEALLDELKARWDSFLKIKKRKNEEEHEDTPSKK